MVTYDFDKINAEVPIEEVLAMHGIYPDRHGKFRIREDDDHASASLHPQRKYGNTIHDFGLSNTFNPLTLTMYLRGIDVFEASQILGPAFGIEPANSDKGEVDYKTMAPSEWALLQIAPDLATKNMDLDVTRYGVESTAKYAERYRMTMNELKGKDLSMYEKIIRTRVVPYVMDLKSAYYSSLYFLHVQSKDFGEDYDLVAFAVKDERLNKAVKELTATEAALIKAIRDTSVRYTPSVYNIERDLTNVIKGNLSFEVGPVTYYSLKRETFRDKTKPFFCLVSLDDYNKLRENGLGDIRYAAFQKGSTSVNLCFAPKDSERVNYLMQALRGKERDLGADLHQELEQEVAIEGKPLNDEVLHGKSVPPKDVPGMN